MRTLYKLTDIILAIILIVPVLILSAVLFTIDKASDMRTYKPKVF